MCRAPWSPVPETRRPTGWGNVWRSGGPGCVMLPVVATTMGVHVMAKGLDKKKETKKKPAKTMKEKRAEKSEKKATRGFAPT